MNYADLLPVTTRSSLDVIQSKIALHENLLATHKDAAEKSSVVLEEPLMDDRLEKEHREKLTEASAMIAVERDILERLKKDEANELHRLKQPEYMRLDTKRREAEKLAAVLLAESRADDPREAQCAALLLEIITTREAKVAQQFAAINDAEALRAECKIESMTEGCMFQGSCASDDKRCPTCPRALYRRVIPSVTAKLEELRASALPPDIAPPVAPPGMSVVKAKGVYLIVAPDARAEDFNEALDGIEPTPVVSSGGQTWGRRPGGTAVEITAPRVTRWVPPVAPPVECEAAPNALAP